jgi:hypothetical protein
MYSQTFTAAAANLIGHASNVAGAAWTVTTAGADDGMGHHVTLRNDSITDHSAKTVTLVGLDANGNALTEVLNAPGTSATVTSTKAFKTLTSATPSATIGADTFDIGWAATAHTPWVALNVLPAAFNTSVAVQLVSGSLNYDVQHTLDDLTEAAIGFNHTGITGSTASDYDGYTNPVRGVRVDVNSHTSGVFTFKVLQAGPT